MKFFGDGEHWVKGRFSDRPCNCCLVGALDFVGDHQPIKGEATARHLADVIADVKVGELVAKTPVRTAPGCGRPFAALCRAKDIGAVRVSSGGIASLI